MNVALKERQLTCSSTFTLGCWQQQYATLSQLVKKKSVTQSPVSAVTGKVRNSLKHKTHLWELYCNFSLSCTKLAACMVLRSQTDIFKAATSWFSLLNLRICWCFLLVIANVLETSPRVLKIVLASCHNFWQNLKETEMEDKKLSSWVPKPSQLLSEVRPVTKAQIQSQNIKGHAVASNRKTYFIFQFLQYHNSKHKQTLIMHILYLVNLHSQVNG